jgi:hypothetical protein
LRDTPLIGFLVAKWRRSIRHPQSHLSHQNLSLVL